MTPTVRALLGAAVGSLITLFLHPTSRPFMTGVTSRASPSVLELCIDANASSLPQPTSLETASLWMQLATHRIVSRTNLSAKERATIVKIARAASEKDKTNAFWPQMEAIVDADGGNLASALEAWNRASTCSKWEDFQTKRLLEARDEISKSTGVVQCWQLAYLYYARSDDFAQCLKSTSRSILSAADYNNREGLIKRYATLLNGDLLRSHAHSSKSSIAAMQIVDLASYPMDSVALPVTPKKLWIGQDVVLANFTAVLHQPDWTERARLIFKNNESVRAFTVHDSNERQTELLALGTVICSSIASAVVVVSALGVLIWGIGRFVAWRLARDNGIKPLIVIAIASVLGTLVVLLTRYIPAGVAAALCAGFLTVAPDRSRKARPSDLGPMFSFVCVVLAIVCSTMFITYLIGTTPAANAVFPSLGVPSDYFDKPLMAGLAVVSFGLVLLMAPIWAVVQRLGTPHVLALSLMRFGSFLAVSGLILSIVLGPLSVYADRRLEATFMELVTNEPVHYFVHR